MRGLYLEGKIVDPPLPCRRLRAGPLAARDRSGGGGRRRVVQGWARRAVAVVGVLREGDGQGPGGARAWGASLR